jgi:hypothetical protein
MAKNEMNKNMNYELFLCQKSSKGVNPNHPLTYSQLQIDFNTTL